MSARKIEKLLRQALLHDGKMQRQLYEYELAEVVDEMRQSLVEDNDDYIFAVTENKVSNFSSNGRAKAGLSFFGTIVRARRST
jgi:hypothetical protein